MFNMFKNLALAAQCRYYLTTSAILRKRHKKLYRILEKQGKIADYNLNLQMQLFKSDIRFNGMSPTKARLIVMFKGLKHLDPAPYVFFGGNSLTVSNVDIKNMRIIVEDELILEGIEMIYYPSNKELKKYEELKKYVENDLKNN
ncbi:hypothetical protein LIER_42681 [Lithospermum erythrorhizon]|uniref:Uncharacterized protein n=1 Tax=Lithospermum erythrorhizon TaxID=34254 RepID=A0AAV3NR61_LITER